MCVLCECVCVSRPSLPRTLPDRRGNERTNERQRPLPPSILFSLLFPQRPTDSSTDEGTRRAATAAARHWGATQRRPTTTLCAARRGRGESEGFARSASAMDRLFVVVCVARCASPYSSITRHLFFFFLEAPASVSSLLPSSSLSPPFLLPLRFSPPDLLTYRSLTYFLASVVDRGE